MTLEEAVAAITKLQTDIATMAANHEVEKGKLKDKISEVIGEKKKLKSKLTSDDEDDESEEPAPKKKKGNETESEALRRVQAENAAALTALKKQLDDANEAAAKAAITTALNDALAKANVGADYRKAAESLFRLNHKIEATESGVLIDGKPVGDSVAAWAKTEGRAFISAPASGGSAANGGPSGTPNSDKPRSKMTPAEKGAYIRTNGQEAYNRLAV